MRENQPLQKGAKKKRILGIGTIICKVANGPKSSDSSTNGRSVWPEYHGCGVRWER